MEGMSALEVALIWIRLVLDQKSDYHGVTLETGNVKRSLEHFVSGVRFCAFIE